MRDEAVDVYQRVLTGVARSWRPLLLVHVVHTLFAVTVLAPLTALLVRTLVALSGGAVVADRQILDFLLTPTGVAALVIVAAVLLAIVALEQAALMAIGFADVQGWRMSAWQAIGFAVRRAAGILQLALRVVIGALVIAVPFLVVAGGLYLSLLTDYDINYYLAERPREFGIATVSISVVLVTMAVLLLRRLSAWSLGLPLLLFQCEAPRDALALSVQHTLDRRWRVCRWWLLWGFAALLLQVLVLAGLDHLGGVLVPLDGSASLSRVLVVLSVLVVIATLAGIVVAAIEAATFALLNVAMFDRWIPRVRETAREVGAAAIEEALPRPARRIIGCGLAAALGFAVLAGYWLLESVRPVDDVEIVAHRGAAGRAPENTLAAVRAAIDDGTDWVEIDVQETADGRVVVVHDSDFMKLAGVNLKVRDGSFDEIRAIDVGSWFDARFAAERVPTLAEVLAVARRRARVMIELKYYGHDQRLEQRVVDIVEAAGMQHDVAIMSLDHRGVQKLRSMRPGWPVGVLMARGVGRVADLDVDFLAVNSGMAKPGLIRQAHMAGKQVFVWTINDPVRMSSMISLGVDGLITDEPAVARRVLDERGDMNLAERLLVQAADRFDWLQPPRRYRDESP